MPAVVLVWVVWTILVLALAALAIIQAPRASAPRWLLGLRRRVGPVVGESVARLGSPATAVVIYLFGAGLIVALSWPLGLLAHASQNAVDWPMFRWFEHRQITAWSHVWRQLTNIGSPDITQRVTVAATVFFTLVWAVRRRQWWVPLFALPLGYCLEKFTQIIIQDVVHRGHPPTTLGTFPSGGCGRVMVVYGMVIFMTVAWLSPTSRRAWVAGWALLACLVSIQAYARIYNLEHWTTDVIGGSIYGLLLISVMASCLRVLVLPAPPPASRELRLASVDETTTRAPRTDVDDRLAPQQTRVS